MMRGACGLAVLMMSAAPAAAAELTLEFPGLRAEGQISVAVFRDAEGWKRRAEPVWAEVRPVAGTVAAGVDGVAVRIIRDLPPGDYAVMAYHDRNGNGRLDTLPVGLPTEPYGFSNDSRGMFGPPAWRSAAFRLPQGGGRQVIRLR